MKILIGTPAYDHQVTGAYHTSILELVKYFERNGVESVSHVLHSTYIHWARNGLATLALQDPSVTHLLFVDADMGFRHQLVAKMIAFGQPVTGCVYPGRANDYGRLLANAARFDDPAAWRAASAPYPASRAIPDEQGRVIVRNGFMQVRAAGTGVMLIKREALERLREAYPELWSEDSNGIYAQFGLTNGVFQPFDHFAPDGGMLIGEDLAFCHRWRDRCQGEIWSCVNETIRHVGREIYVGNFEQMMRQSAPPSR